MFPSRSRWPLLAFYSLLLAALSGCQTLPNAADAPPAADRAAILAMAGGYQVSFQFQQDMVFVPGSMASDDYHSGGQELVLVLHDQPDHIVLQHLLVSGRGHVTKHWRQEWIWQPQQRWRYLGGYRWANEPVAATEAAGRWLQTVWQVDDSPRYAGLGRWQHAHGVSQWVSESTLRPLPRREHSVRQDYDALISINRHVLTADGWVHGQDNLKWQQQADRVIAHESGLNHYRRDDQFDFEPALRYWAQTARYWAAVREHWAQLLAQRPQLVLAPHDPVELAGSHLMALLIDANDLSHQQLDDDALRARIAALIAPYLR